MSWNALAANQTVSYNNLHDAVLNGDFTQKQAFPDSDKEMTRAEVEYQIQVDTINLDNLGILSNQLVVKNDLIGFVEIIINNTNSLDITITGVVVNGSVPEGMSLPLTTGNSTVGKVYEFGSFSVSVTWTYGIPGQNITISDSDSINQCVSGDLGSHIFPNVLFSGLNPVNLVGADGGCA